METEQKIFEKYNWITVDEIGGNPEKTLALRNVIHEAYETGRFDEAQKYYWEPHDDNSIIQKVKSQTSRAIFKELDKCELAEMEWPLGERLDDGGYANYNYGLIRDKYLPTKSSNKIHWNVHKNHPEGER